MFSLLAILIYVAVFIIVLRSVPLIERMLDHWRPEVPPEDRERIFTGRMNTCERCGQAFGHEYLLDGVCIFCKEKATRKGRGPAHGSGPIMLDPELRFSYSVLGCDETDSLEEIRRQYYKRAKELHPDALRSLNLPPAEVEEKTRQFQEVQEAYRKIMNKRRDA